MRADVVVAGGGVMGCALAYQLARRDVDVVLLERAQLGSQSTGRCAGGVRQQFSNEANVRLQRLAVKLLTAFEDEVGAPADFRQVGYLFLLSTDAQVAEFKGLLEMWHGTGLTEARWVGPEDARRLVPILNVDDLQGGTFCPTDGIASPDGVTQGYAAAARRLGARLIEGVELTGVELDGGRVAGVLTSGEPVSTPCLFNCAGAWSSDVGRMAGVEVPVLPYRRHILVTGTFPEVPRETPMTVDFTTSFYFHPEGDGVLMGMSDRSQPPGFAIDVDWGFLERAVAEASHRAPALERAGIKTSWAGLYESTPDHQAILGPIPEVPGLWCACGFSGHGFMQAPAAALVLAEQFADGRSEEDISAFAYERFARGDLVAERNVI